MASIIQLWTPFSLPSAIIYSTFSFTSSTMSKIATQIVQSFGGFGMLVGYSDRVFEAVEKADAISALCELKFKNHSISPSQIAMKDVTISATPSTSSAASRGPQTLLEHLSFTVPRRGNIIIMGLSSHLSCFPVHSLTLFPVISLWSGPSASGKSAFLVFSPASGLSLLGLFLILRSAIKACSSFHSKAM